MAVTVATAAVTSAAVGISVAAFAAVMGRDIIMHPAAAGL
jgi:hypothetical protein